MSARIAKGQWTRKRTKCSRKIKNKASGKEGVDAPSFSCTIRFTFFQVVVEVRLRHARNSERVAQGDLLVLISEHYIKKFSGIGFGRTAETDALFFAAAMPSACRARIFSRSFSATNERICRTMSAMNFPTREQGVERVSSRGISRTRISAVWFS